MINEIRALCAIDGVSGREDKVREYITSRLKGKAESITTDNLGNVIAFVKGKKPAAKKVMISAHMDEVGFIVTHINGDGTIKIAPVGGVDEQVVFGRRIKINEKTAVIGGKAVHNLSADERKKAVRFENMTADIGASSKEEAESLISLGDMGAFCGDFLCLGKDKICSKAIDDRAGCAIMLRMIDEGVEYDTYFAFVVQEEIGLRGSTCAAYTIAPDVSIVLETTTAADIPPSQGDERVCELGSGAVVSFMDRHTIYDRQLYDLAFETAKENGIPCQTKTKVAGGNDAGAIHISRSGVKTCAISVPCRYLHSASCVADINDIENTYRLTKLLLDRINTI